MPQDDADARYRIFIREYESLTQPYEDAAPCLERLGGQKLGIISNGAREQQIGKLQRAGLLDFFSVMVYAEDVGLGKPASSIFLEACRRGECPPEACAYIGDDPDFDVTPSRALGMRGIHLDRIGTGVAAPPVISSLSNLPALLQ
jgi:putative hydrolase of the HAD superfamily